MNHIFFILLFSKPASRQRCPSYSPRTVHRNSNTIVYMFFFHMPTPPHCFCLFYCTRGKQFIIKSIVLIKSTASKLYNNLTLIIDMLIVRSRMYNFNLGINMCWMDGSLSVTVSYCWLFITLKWDPKRIIPCLGRLWMLFLLSNTSCLSTTQTNYFLPNLQIYESNSSIIYNNPQPASLIIN